LATGTPVVPHINNSVLRRVDNIYYAAENA
jgi:hypothetical protein